MTEAPGKKIEQIVNEWMLVHQNSPLGKVALSQLAADGYRELVDYGLNTPYSVKVKWLDVTDLNTVNLPHDYINYIKVGVPIGGQLWTLTLNRSVIGPTATTTDCDISIEQAASESVDTSNYDRWYYTGHYNQNGEYIGKMYSYGGGWNSEGYFKEDKANHRFILDSVTANQIVLEYNSSELGRDTIVPHYAVPAIKRYIDWQVGMADPEAIRGTISYLERLFYDQVMKMRNVQKPFRVDEFWDAYYEDVHGTIKR